MKKLQVMVCGLLIFSILGCPVMAAAAPMDGEVDPTAVEVMDPNVMVPDESIMEDAAPAIPDSSPAEDGTDQGADALPPAGDQIVDAASATAPAAGIAEGHQAPLQVVSATKSHTYYNQFGYGANGLCFASCIAMIVSDLGHKVTPKDVYKANGNRSSITWSKINSAYGVNITTLADLRSSNATNSKNKVISLLNSGKYPQGIYLWIKGEGHAVVARKVVSGKIYCDDPGQSSGGCCIPLEKCYGYNERDGYGGIGHVGTIVKSSSWPGTSGSTTPAKTFKVTLNANGGKVSKSSVTVTNGKTYGSLPTPTRSGYKFDGWYTAAKGGDKVTSSTKVNLKVNQTLYAHWSNNPQKTTYTVTFNPNGGSVSTKTKKVEAGGVIGTMPTPTRSGYQFQGWCDSKEGFGMIVTETNLYVSKNITLYARWKKVETSISFSGLTAPKTHTAGNIFSIGGTITSTNSKIASVKAEVINTSTKKAAISASDNSLNTIKYSLPKSKVDNSLKFGTLKAGTYYIKYTVKTKDGTTSTKQTANFTVKAASKTTISFSGLTAPKTHTAGNIFSIGGTITSTNSKIASVKAEVINTSTKKAAISASDNSLNTIKYNLPKSKVDNSLKFGTLKAGTYYIKYTVKTKDGTTSTKQTANFTVKAKR